MSEGFPPNPYETPGAGGPPPFNPQADMSQLKPPAIALICVAALGLILGPISLLLQLGIIGLGGAGAVAGDEPAAAAQFMLQGTFGVIVTVLSIIVSAVILFGALKMMKGQTYALAVTAAILAMPPYISPCCCIGLPIGIWALIVLMKPEIKSGFTP